MLDRISPEDECQVIGKLATMLHFASEEQIRDALAMQHVEQKGGRRVLLGEILLETGIISSEQLDLLLLVQNFLKTRSLDRRLAKMMPDCGAEYIQKVDIALQKQFELFRETKTIYSLAHILASLDVMPGDRSERESRSFVETLLYRFAIEKLMVAILGDFAHAGEDRIDLSIDHALKTVGEFADADRAYVFLFSKDKNLITNTNEWCSPWGESHRAHCQDLRAELFSTWMRKLGHFEVIFSPCLDSTDCGMNSEDLFLRERGIRSFMIQPMAWADSLMGFVGLEWVRQAKSWSDDISTILKFTAGLFAAVLGRGQALAELRRGEEQYRTLVETINDSLFTLDQQGRFTYANVVMEQTIGQAAEAFVGSHFSTLLSPRDCEEAIGYFEKALTGEQTPLFEVELQSRNEIRIPVELNLAMILNANGQPGGVLGVARDISERKRTENALLESRAKFEHIYENAPVMMYSVNEKGCICDVNKKWIEETRYSRDEAIGKQADFLLIDEIARRRFEEALDQLKSCGSIGDFASQYIKKDGPVMDVRLSGAGIEDPTGGSSNIFIARDVTESNRMERALTKRLEYERTIAGVASHFVGAQKIDDAINNALAEIKQYLRATVVCLYLPDHEKNKVYCTPDTIISGLDAQYESISELAMFGSLLNTASMQRGEGLIVYHPGQDGDDNLREFMAKWGISALLLQPVIVQRRAKGVLGAMVLNRMHEWAPSEIELLGLSSVLIANAIDLKQAEEETQRAYQELNSIYRNSLSGLRVVDNHFTVIQINESLSKMIGMPREQAIGAKCFEIMAGPHCHTEECTLARIRRGEVVKGEEIRRHWADDRESILLLSAAPFYNSEGKLVGMVEDFHDITDKKRLESVAEAVESMNNIGYIFSGIRHEIGNPINSMKMALNVLKTNIGTFPQEKIIKYIDRTISQVSKMEILLRSLKSFSMFEQPFIQEISLKEFLGELLQLAREDFAQQNIRMSASIKPDADIVRVDARALQQVLLNVLTNASDALTSTPVPTIAVSARRAGEVVRVAVNDNGRGMSNIERQNLFKPFCTSKPQGTGLGLVIAKKMLSAMECGIEIQSREGVGTTVTIYLPAGSSHEQESGQESLDHR